MKLMSGCRKGHAGVALMLYAIIGGGASPAHATVHFGHNVFVGGHDFSNQTYDRRHRAVIYLYDRTPRNSGCVWHRGSHGARVKICNLRRIRSGQ